MRHQKEVRQSPILRQRAALAFGSALRSARGNRGISQMNLAVSSDLDPTYVSLLERGHRVPSFIVIIRLADALEISPVRLFAEGVARLPDATVIGTRAVYRLAYRLPDGQLVETEGAYSNFITAVHGAEIQNTVRRASGEPELTHLVEYMRANTTKLGERIP